MKNVGKRGGHLTSMLADKQYSKGYDEGFKCGYFYGLQDGFAKGVDAGVEMMAQEVRDR